MPYVEGESLRDRLGREKQLPVPEALRIAGEVASALDYAHRRGVIHRDIKPENILLHDGRALIADFGIALAASRAGGSRMTETGMSLGTPHYMSPEQAMGEREITPRSDVYALGAVLYEMLLGDPPFTGSTAQAIVAKVITSPPEPLRAHRQTVPPHVEAAVLTALQKLPADRFASAREFADALASPASGATVPVMVAPPQVVARERGWRTLALASAALAACAIVVAAVALRRPGTGEAPVRRYGLSLGNLPWNGNPFRNGLALSPDGSRFVYAGPGAEGSVLFLRARDQLDATPLHGTAGAVHPFFSPDGTRIGFTQPGQPIAVRTIGASGTPPVTVADSSVGLDGATWSADGFIYFDGITQGGTRGLMRVPEAGGPLEQVTTVDTAAGEADHMRPLALPDGRGIVFTRIHRRKPTDLAVLDARTREIKVLTQGVLAQWLGPRWLLYLTAQGALFAVAFDLERLAIVGDPVPIADGTTPARSAQTHLAAGGGTVMYLTPERTSKSRQLVRVGLDGVASAYDPGWQDDFRTVAVSPDGSRAAVSIFADGEQHLWIKQLPRGPLARLTFEGSPASRAFWADDRTLLHIAVRAGLGVTVRRRADGAGEPEVVSPLRATTSEALRTPDGRWYVFRILASEIVMRRIEDTTYQPLVTGPAVEGMASVSPDGRWLAYASDESGRVQVYVRPFPNAADARWLVSPGPGAMPRWAPDGRTLYYVTPDSMVATPVTAGATPSFGVPRALFSRAPYHMEVGSWDILPDGRGFVMIRRGDLAEQPELVVVDHLDRELAKEGGAR
jgi:serine/threonine-protein kinase